MRISAKNAMFLSAVIRRKKLSVVRRLLQDLVDGKRALDGKYYTKAAAGMLGLLESCEANAKALGLDAGTLFVHAAATRGANMRRSRRKSGFGSRLKSTNLEIMLVSRGRAKEAKK